jgi:hypothetical protein
MVAAVAAGLLLWSSTGVAEANDSAEATAEPAAPEVAETGQVGILEDVDLCAFESATDPVDYHTFDVVYYELGYLCDAEIWGMTVGLRRSGNSFLSQPFELELWLDGARQTATFINNRHTFCWEGRSNVVISAAALSSGAAPVYRPGACFDRGRSPAVGDAEVVLLDAWTLVVFVDARMIGSPPVNDLLGGIEVADGFSGIDASFNERFPDLGLLEVSTPPPTFVPTAEPGGARRSEAHSIFRLYAAYLGRQPDAPGLAYWQDEYFSCRRSLNDISAFFASSPEFQARYGALSEWDFVRLIYWNVLGRPGENEGLYHWTSILVSRVQTKGQVMTGFTESAEYVQRTGTEPPSPPVCVAKGVTDSVYRLYQAYFLREPDAGGERHWNQQYGRCLVPLAAVSDSFASSPEFAARYGSLSDRAFVELVYQNVLGRPGETSGVDYWTGMLQQRALTRGGVMIGFSESAEMRERTGTAAPVSPC